MCQYKELLKIECPGCGLTRAFHAFLNGNFIQAWHCHPALYFIGVFIVFGIFQLLLPKLKLKLPVLISVILILISEFVRYANAS